MGKDQEIIQEYFTRYYPKPKKFVHNEMVEFLVGGGMLAIFIAIVFALIRGSSVVVGDVSESINNPKKYKEYTKNQDELEREIKNSDLDEKTKKEYSDQLNEIKKLQEEIKGLKDSREKDINDIVKILQDIQGNNSDKKRILDLILEIKTNNNPDEAITKIAEVKKIIAKTDIKDKEINEKIKKLLENLNKAKELIEKLSKLIKDFCVNSFEYISSLMKKGSEKVKKGLSGLWGFITKAFGGLFNKKLEKLNADTQNQVNSGNIFLKLKFKNDEKFELDEPADSIENANFIYLKDKQILIINNEQGRIFFFNKVKESYVEDLIDSGDVSELVDFNGLDDENKLYFSPNFKSIDNIKVNSIPISVEKIDTDEQNEQKVSIKFTLDSEDNKRGMIDIFQNTSEEEGDPDVCIIYPLGEDGVSDDSKYYSITDQSNLQQSITQLIKNYDQPFDFNCELTVTEDKLEKIDTDDLPPLPDDLDISPRSSSDTKKKKPHSIVNSIERKMKNKESISNYIKDDQILLGKLIEDNELKKDDLVMIFVKDDDFKDYISPSNDEEENVNNDDVFPIVDDPFSDFEEVEMDFGDGDSEPKLESFKRNKKLQDIMNEIFYSDIKHKYKYYFESIDMENSIDVIKNIGKGVEVISYKFPQVISSEDIDQFTPSNVYKISLERNGNDIQKILYLGKFNLENHLNSIILYQYAGTNVHVGQLIVNFDKIGENPEIYKNIVKYFDDKNPIVEAKLSVNDLRKFYAANPVEIKINDDFIGKINFDIRRKGIISSKKIENNKNAQEIKDKLKEAEAENMTAVEDESKDFKKIQSEQDPDKIKSFRNDKKTNLFLKINNESLPPIDKLGSQINSKENRDNFTLKEQSAIYADLGVFFKTFEGIRDNIDKQLKTDILLQTNEEFENKYNELKKQINENNLKFEEKKKEILEIIKSKSKTETKDEEIKIDLKEFLYSNKFKKSDKEELVLNKQNDKHFLNFNIASDTISILKKDISWAKNFHPDNARTDLELLMEQNELQIIDNKKFEDLKFKIEVKIEEKDNKKIIIIPVKERREILTLINSVKSVNKKDSSNKEESVSPLSLQSGEKEIKEKDKSFTTGDYFLPLNDIMKGSVGVVDQIPSNSQAGIIFRKIKGNTSSQYNGFLWIKNKKDISTIIGFNELKKLGEYFNISLNDYVLNEEFDISNITTNFISDDKLKVEITKNAIVTVFEKGNLKSADKGILAQKKRELLSNTIKINKDDPEYKNVKSKVYKDFGISDFIDKKIEPKELSTESISGFIRVGKDKAITGRLIKKDANTIKSTFNNDVFDLYYYIKNNDEYLYYKVDENLLAILVLIRKAKKIKYKNFTSTSELKDINFITEDYALLKRVTNISVNKTKEVIRKIKKSDNVSFGVGELENGVFKFPKADNLKPKIKESSDNKKEGNEQEQQLAVDSYFNKDFDSIIINEVFKNWKK